MSTSSVISTIIGKFKPLAKISYKRTSKLNGFIKKKLSFGFSHRRQTKLEQAK